MGSAGWLAGVAINLVGSIMINLGTNIMKMGHNKLAVQAAASPAGSKHAIYKIREWQVGVTMFSLGNVANFVSFGYAAQSLLAAIGCVQFVSNVIFASLVLKEQVSRNVLLATAFIVAGCVLLVSGGSHASEKFVYKDLLRLYSEPAYISYLSVGGAAVVATYACYWIGQKAVTSKGQRAAQVWQAALPVLYSVFSALIGTQSVLFSKTMAVLLRSTFSGDNQLGKWFTWVVLFAFLTTAVFWVTRLNKGLKMFPALVIVPSLQICWTLFSILSGMLYFQEYVGMKALPTALFVVGVVVVFAGVFLLTRASQPSAAPAAGAKSVGAALKAKASTPEAAAAAAGAADGGEGSWELRAVRPHVPGQHELGAPGHGHGSSLLGLAQQPASHQQRQQQAWQHVYHSDDDDEAEEEEADGEDDYERALLSATSFTSSQQLQHQHTMRGARPTLAGTGWRHPAEHRNEAAGAEAPIAPGGNQPSLSEAHLTGPEAKSQPRRPRGQKRWLDKASSLKRRMAHDFSLDEGAAARLTLGLGDAHMPGFSLFAMPVVDLAAMPAQGPGGSEASGGRWYGRLPESSTAGMAPQQAFGGPRGTDDHHDGTGCISHGGGAVFCRASEVNQSFLHPPQRSSPSVDAGSSQPVGQSVLQGLTTGINPLANAIDICTSGPGSAKAAPTLSRQASAEVQGLKQQASARAQDGWRVIRSNLQELTATLGGGGGSSGARAYERMTSHEEEASAGGASRRSSGGGEPGT